MLAAWGKQQSTLQAHLWEEACSTQQASASAFQATAACYSLKREASSAISGSSSAHAACSKQKRLCHSSAARPPPLPPGPRPPHAVTLSQMH